MYILGIQNCYEQNIITQKFPSTQKRQKNITIKYPSSEIRLPTFQASLALLLCNFSVPSFSSVKHKIMPWAHASPEPWHLTPSARSGYFSHLQKDCSLEAFRPGLKCHFLSDTFPQLPK